MTTEIDRLLDSAREAHRLAESMLASKHDPGGGIEAVAQGVRDAGRAAELTAEQQKGRDLVDAVLGHRTGPWPTDDLRGGLFSGLEDQPRFASLRTSGLKTALARRFAVAVGIPGSKALLDVDGPVVSVPIDPQPYGYGDPPTSLIEILPAVVRPVTYRYLRQSTETNNAAPVASGGTKPTSVYGITPVDATLSVVAHISEAIDRYLLQDSGSLENFIRLRMIAGLHEAVEDEIVNGTGIAPHLRGLAATSGIQTQAWTTSEILTARAAVTKIETLGLVPYFFVFAPADWEKVETTTLTAGQYVLNSEGQRSGLPVDAAARRLWSVPVTVSNAVTAGVGYLLANGAVQLATDGQVQAELSSATGTDFQTNSVRLRVESRWNLDVVRPFGVVQMDLTA